MNSQFVYYKSFAIPSLLGNIFEVIETHIRFLVIIRTYITGLSLWVVSTHLLVFDAQFPVQIRFTTMNTFICFYCFWHWCPSISFVNNISELFTKYDNPVIQMIPNSGLNTTIVIRCFSDFFTKSSEYSKFNIIENSGQLRTNRCFHIRIPLLLFYHFLYLCQLNQKNIFRQYTALLLILLSSFYFRHHHLQSRN